MDNPIFNQELRCFFSWLFFVLIFVMKGKIMTFSYNFDDDILEHQRLVDADNELELKRLLRKYGSLEGIEKNADIRDSMAYMMANQNGLAQKVLTQKTGNSLLSSQGTQYAKNDRTNYASDTNLPAYVKTGNALIDRMIPVLKGEEELYRHIYIDSTWNKTVGIGANIDRWEQFRKLNWQVDGRAATEEEKRTAFNSFDAETSEGKKNVDKDGNLLEKNNKKASYYEYQSPLRILDKEAWEIFLQHIKEDVTYLHREFPEFDSFPQELQNVLLDIKFNTGNVSADEWPKLRKAIAEKNLYGKDGIIYNVNREDVSLKRNNWAKQQIRNIKHWY